MNIDLPEKHIKELRKIVKKDKKKYDELRKAFQNAGSDEQRIGLIQGAILTDKALRKFQPKLPGKGGEVAGTVTIVVVTVTITWPSTANLTLRPGALASVKRVRKVNLKTAKARVRTRPKTK